MKCRMSGLIIGTKWPNSLKHVPFGIILLKYNRLIDYTVIFNSVTIQIFIKLSALL